MLCWRTSILADTSPARACSTWLAPAQFHDRLLADPHTRQASAETPPLLEEPNRIGMDRSKQGGECPKHGASARSLAHGTFLHVAQLMLKPPAPLHYISRDHPNAHDLTNPSGSSPHKDILRYPEISWDILRYLLIRISQDIFSRYLKDSARISQRYLPRRYPQISFDIFIHIFLCIFLLIYVYLFAYPEISFFLSALYPWYIFLFYLSIC